MLIRNISCSYKEYRLNNGVWLLVQNCNYMTDSNTIKNILESKPYFVQLGGYMDCNYKSNRRFGNVCNEIVSVSFCRTVKKVFSFNYNKAQEVT